MYDVHGVARSIAPQLGGHYVDKAERATARKRRAALDRCSRDRKLRSPHDAGLRGLAPCAKAPFSQREQSVVPRLHYLGHGLAVPAIETITPLSKIIVARARAPERRDP
jgi:hypothetical protein